LDVLPDAQRWQYLAEEKRGNGATGEAEDLFLTA
jgi:hypothetical protein